ncbi:hypothetical protein BHM03_00041504 [Ensete ventricosum]|nr:hypothetical protein BHM03_00041504 [Ensete ventricosum]
MAKAGALTTVDPSGSRGPAGVAFEGLVLALTYDCPIPISSWRQGFSFRVVPPDTDGTRRRFVSPHGDEVPPRLPVGEPPGSSEPANSDTSRVLPTLN